MNIKELFYHYRNEIIKCPVCESVLNIKDGQNNDVNFDNKWFECTCDKDVSTKQLVYNDNYISFFVGYLYYQKYALYIPNENYYIRYLELYCDSNKEILRSFLYLYNEFENIFFIQAEYQILDLNTEAPFFDIEKIKTLLLFQ